MVISYRLLLVIVDPVIRQEWLGFVRLGLESEVFRVRVRVRVPVLVVPATKFEILTLLIFRD